MSRPRCVVSTLALSGGLFITVCCVHVWRIISLISHRSFHSFPAGDGGLSLGRGLCYGALVSRELQNR
ncbi:hypothetical protein ACNKHV_16975 [Shigella flexneri]